MTTLGSMVNGTLTIPGVGTFPEVQILDIPGLAASVTHLTASASTPGPLGPGPAILASMAAWSGQDDDAHEPCSLTACRNPLHPGPCKGWKGLLHAVSPGAYHQIEGERVRKANERRVKRIAALRAQGKPIPRHLLAEIKPKPAPNHPAHHAQPVPLSQVNQKADLAGGQAHAAGNAVSKAAGVTPNTAPPLPLGPKQKKPSVAGRGPAFVITQPKVTDQYKLDKAAKITPQEWAALSDVDKRTIRNEITAIKGRGFGPQQKKADELLLKLDAPKPPSTSPAAPGKVTLGQAVKAPPIAPPSPVPSAIKPSAPLAPGTAPHIQHANAVVNRTAPKAQMAKTHLDAYGQLSKADFDLLSPDAQKTIRDDLANAKAKFLDPSKKQAAADLLNRFGSTHLAVPAAPASKPTHIDDVKVGDTFTDTKGTYVITETPAQGKIKGYRMTSTAHGGKEVLATKAQLAQDFGLDTTPRTPAAPAAAKGYSDPMAQAMKEVRTGGDRNELLRRVGTLTPAQVGQLTDDDRKALISRLDFAAGSATSTKDVKDRAEAYKRIIENGSTAQKSLKLDHEPSLSELHAEETKTGIARATASKTGDALIAADAKNMDRADRIKDLSALSKPEFDSLKPEEQRKITDALQGLHVVRSSTLGAATRLDQDVEQALKKYTGMHPGIHRLKQAETDFNAGKIDADALHHAFLRARVRSPSAYGDNSTPGAALEKESQRIAENNTKIPLWLRATMVENPYGKTSYSAISHASNKYNFENAPRLSGTEISNIFQPTEAELGGSHPVHAEAVKALRVHLIETGLRGQPGVPSGSPWSTSTRNHVVDNLLHISSTSPLIPPERLKEFKGLPDTAQAKVLATLKDRLTGQTDAHAKTAAWLPLRELEGAAPLSDAQRDAAVAATERFPFSSHIDTYRKLDPAEFNDLPYYTQSAIINHLSDLQIKAEAGGPVKIWSPHDDPLKVFPTALAAHLVGVRTKYADQSLRNVSDVANYGRKIINPYDRTRVYAYLTFGQFGHLSTPDRAEILGDLDKIASDASLNLQTRYGALFTKDLRLQQGTHLNVKQLTALASADPSAPIGDQHAITNLTALDKADYDKLDKTYREAIDERIKTLPGLQQQALAAKFHPAAAPASPTGYTPTTTQTNVPPHVQAALDTIYGVHPSGKSHTMAHQLTTYGALRGSDFSQLNAQEQGHLLGDLSFIATTAKGPSADKAKKLIDRFTPPGTPSGHTPTPAIVPPANAVAGQVRYATPLHGLFKSKNPGKSGDKWIYPSGHSKVWGEYGASGLLIKHTDPNTGEERYLMVQRGPAISDPGKWTFPGGASESKETPHQGATRETIEELGLKDDQFKDADVHGDHTYSIPGHPWKYTTVAVSVPNQFQPNLSTAHARAETSDAKWMTLDEIRALDKNGELHGPIANGALEKNVISLYPQAGAQTLRQAVRPGPVTKRPGRLRLPPGGRQIPAQFNAWPHAHKQSKGKDLIPDRATFDAQRQKIKNDRTMYDGKTADGRLAAIGAQQGFDDTPTVVDKKEMDRLLATGDYIEAWRGVTGAGGWSARSRGSSGGKTAKDINEEMRTGPAYYGKGIFGNGYYLATQRRVAQNYSDGTDGSIVRILIPKSAVIQKYDEVSRKSHANPRASKAKGNTYEDSTFYDPGRYAAAKGLDGIEIESHHRSPGGGASHVAAHGKPAFNWLNRSVLIVQKEPG